MIKIEFKDYTKPDEIHFLCDTIKEKDFIDNNFSEILDEYVNEYTGFKSFKDFAEYEIYPAAIPIDRDAEYLKLFKSKRMYFKISNMNLLEEFINKKYYENNIA